MSGSELIRTKLAPPLAGGSVVEVRSLVRCGNCVPGSAAANRLNGAEDDHTHTQVDTKWAALPSCLGRGALREVVQYWGNTDSLPGDAVIEQQQRCLKNSIFSGECW